MGLTKVKYSNIEDFTIRPLNLDKVNADGTYGPGDVLTLSSDLEAIEYVPQSEIGASELGDLQDVAFTVPTPGSTVDPNDQQVLAFDENLGVWTNSNVLISIDELTDVEISNPNDQDVLTYDATLELWISAPSQASSDVEILDDLLDVTVDTPTEGQVLTYNETSSQWENADATGGSETLSLNDLTDVTIYTPVEDKQILQYSAASDHWFNEPDTSLKAVVDDAAPYLGGSLNVNGYDITAGPDGDIILYSSQNIVLDGQRWPNNIGANGQILTTDSSGNLSWETISGVSSTLTGLDDTLAVSVSSGYLRWNSIGSIVVYEETIDWSVISGSIDSGSIQAEAVQDICAEMFTDGIHDGIDFEFLDQYNRFDVTNLDKGSDQFIFKNIASSGNPTINASSNNDTVNFEAGSNVTITVDDLTNTVTISSTGTGGGGGDVTSVFGRTGDVIAQQGDYAAYYTQPGDNVSVFTNDANYRSTGDNVSLFTNDAGYITSAEVPENDDYTFIGLSDTPASYSGQNDRILKVSGNALIFADPPANDDYTFIGLDDTPTSYSGQGGKYLQVNGSDDGVVFADSPPGGEANTASNIGTGEGEIFAQKNGVDLEFKSIKAGTNINISQDADEVLISADAIVGDGEANTASNIGTGEGQSFAQKVGEDLEFRSIKAGTNVTVSQDSNEILISADVPASSGEANTASNIGTGQGEIFAQKSGVDLEFKTLNAGSNITITQTASEVTIAGGGTGGGANFESIRVNYNPFGTITSVSEASSGITSTTIESSQWVNFEFTYSRPPASILYYGYKDLGSAGYGYKMTMPASSSLVNEVYTGGSSGNPGELLTDMSPGKIRLQLRTQETFADNGEHAYVFMLF